MEILKRIARHVLREEIRLYLDTIDSITRGSNYWCEIGKKAIKDLQFARREIDKLKSQDPLGRTLDVSRHHAAQQRIRDLEADLDKALRLLTKLRANGTN